ncbi:MAG: sugar-binding transcriptional regulator [Chloroflexi bacterium]|nr:sugar-binding transcriptional regulator [Chloroflexota bacterium]
MEIPQGKSNPAPVDSVDKTLVEPLVRAAWMYYVENKTQQDIAERMGISRLKVLRLLRDARDQGIVNIDIRTPLAPYLNLENRLREKFALRDAIVTTAAEEGDPLYTALASAAARFLEQRLQDQMVVGMGLARTLLKIPDLIRVPRPIKCTFVALTGGLSYITNVDTYNLFHKMAIVVGGNVKYILAPFIVSSREIKNALLQDETIQSAIHLARSSTLAMVSVGVADKTGLIYQFSQMSPADLEEIRKLGGVGDILGRFYNQAGQELPIALRDRTIGVDIKELKAIPTVVMVAGGPTKRAAILAALHGKIPHILITDTQTAQWLVEQAIL